MNDNKENEILETMTEVEYYPDFLPEDMAGHFTKMPIADLNALGSGFAPLATGVFQMFSGQAGKSGFYKVAVPKMGKLAFSSKKSAFIGGVMNLDNQVMGQASLTHIPFDPIMAVMAVALMNIDMKLSKIQETTTDIIVFLEQKEKSKQRGNLAILNDVQQNYKYNWDNDKYKTNKHILIQEIRRESEQNIIFYRDMITKEVSKQDLIHLGKNVKDMSAKAQSDLMEYQLALYLYAFSSFLEVMLLENYESGYLNGVSQKIEEYSYRYRELYTECYNQIEKYSKTSVDSHVLKGLSIANKFAGEVASRVPGVGKTKVDETLIKAGTKLGQFNEKLTQQTMDQFSSAKNNFVRPFIDNINMMNALNNKPLELVLDRDNIYIGMN